MQAIAVVQNRDPIIYSLRDDKGWFQIDNSSGVITTARTLDREVGVVHKVPWRF